MAKLLEDAQADNLPFKIASGIADMNAAEASSVPQLNVPTNGVDIEGFRAQLGNAVAALKIAAFAPKTST